MRESFFGLNVAVRGLFTAQRSLDIVNHNLNNVNTPGYSRQRAVQVAAKPMPVFDGTGMIGTGSDIVAIERVRDEYIDYKYWSENVTAGEWNAKKEILADLEATFNEPSDNGFTRILDQFYASLQELAKDPSSTATRALVRERGVSVAKYFNSTAVHFEKLQTDVNYRIKTKVEEVNSLATQIQQLNRQIYASELDGNTANDLRDQRSVLVDKMSGLANIEVNEVASGKLPNGKDDMHFVVTISGKAIVDHFAVSKLSTVQRKTKLNPEDIDNLYEVGWEDGNSLNIRGGELKGYLDLRDGNEGENGSSTYRGIPYYIKKMNQFVQTFARAFNEGFADYDASGAIDQPGEDGAGHADGYRMDSQPTDQPSGVRFFTMLGTNGIPLNSTEFLNGAATTGEIFDAYKNLTAKNFTVGYEVMNQPSAISVSDAPAQNGNIVNLNALIALRHNPNLFSEGAPEDFMKSLVATLGIDSQQAVLISDTQQNVMQQVENRRLSDSGVSIDEEMTNLVKFQQAYNACAKMVATMGEIYDTLVNRLGVR